MSTMFDVVRIRDVFERGLQWADAELLSANMLGQGWVVLICAGLGWLLAQWLQRRISGWLVRYPSINPLNTRVQRSLSLLWPALWLVLQWTARFAAETADWPNALLGVLNSLLAAWIVIRVVSDFVSDPVLARVISLSVWIIAALTILDWLPLTMALLDSVGFTIGTVRLSPLVIIKAVFSLAVMLWAATLLSGMLERRIRVASNLTPSVKVLFAKLLQIVLISLAFIIGLSTVGIDLTAFAVFGGAVGVGIGFGLQKIVSNLISGMILLLDRSIKPGDVITVGEYYGSVNSLGARYVSVITRDGIEHLIPNEELITTRVENWSYTDTNIRLRARFGIHYGSDPHQAMALSLEAIAEVPRVLKEPAPTCLLIGFGDSSVDFEVRFWIADPHNGRASVISAVLLKVWDTFHEHGIEFPYPQRDLHIRTPHSIDRLAELLEKKLLTDGDVK